MNYETYQQLFNEILDNGHTPYPYNNEAYLNYTKLNRSRMKRWDKQLVLDEQLIEKLKALEQSHSTGSSSPNPGVAMLRTSSPSSSRWPHKTA